MVMMIGWMESEAYSIDKVECETQDGRYDVRSDDA